MSLSRTATGVMNQLSQIVPLSRSWIRTGVILGFIVLVSVFFRLYNLPNNLHYTGDEGRDVIIAREIITGKRFPLAGPPSSVGELKLGPLYYYLISPFLLLFNFEPIGPAMFIASLSVATSVLLYFVTAKFFSNYLAGMVAAWLYAISPVAVEHGRWSWNPNMIPFFALLFIYSLWQVFEEKKEKWAIATGVSLAFILQSHYLGLISFPILLIAYFWKKPKFKDKRYLIIGGGLFLLLMSPLLAYEFLRDFYNIRGFLKILAQQSGDGLSLISWPVRSLGRLRQLGANFIGLEKNSFFSIALSLVVLIFWFFLERDKKRWWLIGAWLVTGILLMGLYRETPINKAFTDHYLAYLWPAWSVVLGVLIAYLVKEFTFGGIGALVLVSLFLISQSQKAITREITPSVQATKEVVEFINERAGGRRFNFALLAEDNYDSAYRYFFELWGMPVEYKAATDQLFVLCEGEVACQPRGHPKWEIAVFEAEYNGQVEIMDEWDLGDYFHIVLFVPTGQTSTYNASVVLESS